MWKLIVILLVIRHDMLVLENARLTSQRLHILEYLNQPLYLLRGVIRVLVGSWILIGSWVLASYRVLGCHRVLDPGSFQGPRFCFSGMSVSIYRIISWIQPSIGLKTFLYVCVNIKTIFWKFRFLNPKIYRVIWSWRF